MRVIDLEGNEYPIQATTTNENEVNGNQTLSATILPTKVNKSFIADIAEMWRIIDHDDVEHKIVYAKRKGKGAYKPEYEKQDTNTFYYRPTQPVVRNTSEPSIKKSTQLEVEIKAVPRFFDELDNDRIYERIDKHMTALEAFNKILQGTNFDFSLGDQFSAVQWEGFGEGETRLETFKRALERYKCEFRISGNMIFLERRIGRDTQFQYRHRLNASNIEQEIDAGEMWTYAMGYGDYKDEGGMTDDDKSDWEHAKLIREYTSPLAKIIGKRHAPPIKNANITTKKKMDEELKAIVDESLKLSVSADVYDLKKQGYPVAQSEVGDRVFLIDPRIGLDDEVRVISQSKTRNWKGEVIDLNITWGSERIAKRHQSQLSTAVKDINDLIAGRKKLPYSVLPAAEQTALKALREAQTELIFGTTENGIQGIIAQEKDDPNRMVWLNSAGWLISTDGGATSKVAATADGIVADVITAGTLNADQVAIMGGDGDSYTYLSGDYFEARGQFTRTWFGEKTTYDVKTKLENGYLRFRNDTEDRSLYISEFGISTYMDGTGDYVDSDGLSSGSIIWWDTDYSPTGEKGITVNSWGGTATLVSDRHHALVKSRYSTKIESTESNVTINPYTNDTKRHFVFTKSDDRLQGYLLYGGTDETQPGIRFGDSNKGIIQVVDSNRNTGGDTTIEAGYGEFNTVRMRPGNSYLNLHNDSMFKIGFDSERARVASEVIYRRTYSKEHDVVITENGTLGRRTSSERYKVNIENQFPTSEKQLEHSRKLLDLEIVKWNDKCEAEILCNEIETGKKLSDDDFKIQKYVGVTSEKVYESGFSEHVNTNNNGELEGVDHSRLLLHGIPIMKDHDERITKIEKLLGAK